MREKVPFDQLSGVMQLIAQAEAKVKPDGGRVLLRYSGTEPKARLLLEGRNANELKQWGDKICEAIQKQVGDNGG